MSGSRPDPDAVSASGGTADGVDAVGLGDGGATLLDQLEQVGAVRRKIRPARGHGVVAVDRRRMAGPGTTWRPSKFCPIEAGPDDGAARSVTSEPFAFAGATN